MVKWVIAISVMMISCSTFGQPGFSAFPHRSSGNNTDSTDLRKTRFFRLAKKIKLADLEMRLTFIKENPSPNLASLNGGIDPNIIKSVEVDSLIRFWIKLTNAELDNLQTITNELALSPWVNSDLLIEYLPDTVSDYTISLAKARSEWVHSHYTDAIRYFDETLSYENIPFEIRLEYLRMLCQLNLADKADDILKASLTLLNQSDLNESGFLNIYGEIEKLASKYQFSRENLSKLSLQIIDLLEDDREVFSKPERGIKLAGSYLRLAQILESAERAAFQFEFGHAILDSLNMLFPKNEAVNKFLLAYRFQYRDFLLENDLNPDKMQELNQLLLPVLSVPVVPVQPKREFELAKTLYLSAFSMADSKQKLELLEQCAEICDQMPAQVNGNSELTLLKADCYQAIFNLLRKADPFSSRLKKVDSILGSLLEDITLSTILPERSFQLAEIYEYRAGQSRDPLIKKTWLLKANKIRTRLLESGTYRELAYQKMAASWRNLSAFYQDSGLSADSVKPVLLLEAETLRGWMESDHTVAKMNRLSEVFYLLSGMEEGTETGFSWLEEAVKFKREVVKQQPGLPDNRKTLVLFLDRLSWRALRLKKYKLAENYAKEGLTIENNHPQLNSNYTIAVVLQGKMRKVEKNFSEWNISEDEKMKQIPSILLKDLEFLELAGSVPGSLKKDLNKLKEILKNPELSN